MIFTDGFEIRNDDLRHKFGSAMAEYLYGMADSADDQAGDVQFSGWVGRFGKRVLMEDSMGFVNVERFDTVEQAQTIIDEVAAEDDVDDEVVEVKIIHGDVVDALWAHDDGSDA